MPNLKLDALLWAEMVELGIVPFNIDTVRAEVDRRLEGLSEEDSRRIRRKFRKLWRKSRLGLRPDRGNPDQHTMRARKMVVYRTIFRRIWSESRDREGPWTPFD